MIKYVLFILAKIKFEYSVIAFKIFSIDDSTFYEDIDLRGTDTVNLNYSFTDVTWNPKDGKDDYSFHYLTGSIKFPVMLTDIIVYFRAYTRHCCYEWSDNNVELE